MSTQTAHSWHTLGAGVGGTLPGHARSTCCNGWSTSQGLHTEEQFNLILGCRACETMAHYLCCGVLRSTVAAMMLGRSVGIGCWLGVQADATSAECIHGARRFAVATSAYHWAFAPSARWSTSAGYRPRTRTWPRARGGCLASAEVLACAQGASAVDEEGRSLLWTCCAVSTSTFSGSGRWLEIASHAATQCTLVVTQARFADPLQPQCGRGICPRVGGINESAIAHVTSHGALSKTLPPLLRRLLVSYPSGLRCRDRRQQHLRGSPLQDVDDMGRRWPA